MRSAPFRSRTAHVGEHAQSAAGFGENDRVSGQIGMFVGLGRSGPRCVLVILLSMSTTMPLADVKAHLSELVSRVYGQHERVTVTVHGRPSAVLVSVEDLESLEETIAILSDGDAVAALLASEAELARGEIVSQAELVEAVAKRRRSAS